MYEQLAQQLFERMDRRIDPPTIQTINDPKTGAPVMGHFTPLGGWVPIATGEPKIHRFPPVFVHSAASLVAYATAHATEAIATGRALLAVNKDGLVLSIDYGAAEEAEARRHTVTFAAKFDEECEVAAKAILESLGKWVPLATFESLLDKCAPFIVNFAHLEEAACNMEGHETARIARTKQSYNVTVQGEVTSAVDIPKVVSVVLGFMGHEIQAEIPLRLTVENKQVQFMLVDNGAIAKARMAVLKSIMGNVQSTLPNLLTISGRI